MNSFPNSSTFVYSLNLEIHITIPYFNRQSYFQLKSLTSIKYFDLTFATERQNGLVFYSNDKLKEFYFIISIRNQFINIM
jgi:hypothetical protein